MPPTAPDRPLRVLAVADVQTGYHHASISRALGTLERIGRESGEFETVLRTDSQLITRSPVVGVGAKYGGKRVNAPDLGDFDVLFLLPSGAGTLSEAQRADLLAFVREDGRGLVAGHAATVGFFDWPEFGALLGARLAGEVHGPARVIVEDPDFPGLEAFHGDATLFDEQHAILGPPFDRADSKVVLRLDPRTLPKRALERRPDGDFPAVWTREDGAGRVCNVAWGHEPETWEDPRFQALVRGAVQWAAGPVRARR